MQSSKKAAVSFGAKASEKAGQFKAKIGDEEYQSNLKKNAADTLSKAGSAFSSWWSTTTQSVTNIINENLGDAPNGGVKLYNRESTEEEKQQQHHHLSHRKKMAALSSDDYFNKDVAAKSNNSSYGSGLQTNMNNNNNNNNNQTVNEVDLLGMTGTVQKKKTNIDDIPAPFQKKKTKNKKIKDDFDDDWGFSDDEEEEIKDKKDKKNKKDAKDDITDMMNGMTLNTNKTQKKQVESLLDFDNHKITTKEQQDGNSSDDLEDFFKKMENEESGDDKKKNKKDTESPLDTQDITDILGADMSTNDNNNDDFDWGFGDD